MAEKQYYKPAEAAEILDVHQHTIYRWLRSGELEGRKIGNQWRIPERELKE